MLMNGKSCLIPLLIAKMTLYIEMNNYMKITNKKKVHCRLIFLNKHVSNLTFYATPVFANKNNCNANCDFNIMRQYF